MNHHIRIHTTFKIKYHTARRAILKYNLHKLIKKKNQDEDSYSSEEEKSKILLQVVKNRFCTQLCCRWSSSSSSSSIRFNRPLHSSKCQIPKLPLCVRSRHVSIRIHMARSKCHRSQSQTKGRLRNAGGGKFEKSQNPSLRATYRGKKKRVSWRSKKMTDPKK